MRPLSAPGAPEPRPRYQCYRRRAGARDDLPPAHAAWRRSPVTCDSRWLPPPSTTVIPIWAPPLGADGCGRIKAAVEAAQRLQPADCDGGGGRGKKNNMQRAEPAAHRLPLGGGWGEARSSVLLSSLCRPTGEERCPGARATPRGRSGATHAGATVWCTPWGAKGGQQSGAARRERKPAGLKPEHGAYRSPLQRWWSPQRRASPRPLQHQLSGAHRRASAHSRRADQWRKP